MFIVRRITKEKLEINTCLGTDYVHISKEKNLEQFKIDTGQWKPEDLKNIYGLVVYNEGESIIPLYEESQYYIMTSDGQTFDNISNK